MYHPSRGGVRGGRDQFSWDDVKVDKHRENYLGHSIKAPVGRWQKGKDLHWYNREKHSSSDMEAIKEEIKRVKEQEEQAMREALGLAPKRASQPRGSRLDKHEFSELVKRGSTAEDVGEGHAEAARVQGLGFSRGGGEWERSGSIQQGLNDVSCERVKTAMPMPSPPVRNSNEGGSEDEISKRKRRREDRKHKKLEKRHAPDSDDKRSRRKEKIRPDSD